jgi:hypothetical protein
LTGPFSLIRDLLRHTDELISISQYGGILRITLGGFVQITSPFLEEMKKSGFVLRSFHNLIDRRSLPQNIEIDTSDECDVPTFVWTIIRFQDTEFKDRELPPAPPIEVGDDVKSFFAVDEQTKESKEEDVNLEVNSPIQGGVNS